MQLSTVKRESLIPPAYLVSIALLLTVAFIVLLPSGETFKFSVPEQSSSDEEIFDELDLAYLKAREASGDLTSIEMRTIMETMIVNDRWQQAQQLMVDWPNVKLGAGYAFLLNLENTSSNYFDDANEADSASNEAALVGLLNEFLDTPALHNDDTLQRAAQVSAQLQQPEMAASYSLLLAINDPDNAVDHLEECARVLAYYDMYGQAAECYRTAITKTENNNRVFSLKRRLILLLSRSGDTITANAELEKLVQTAPREQKELNQLASLALSSERPDLAYPIYAELSHIDEKRAIMWLEKAATWAEASNLPGLAAEYVLDIENISGEQFKASLAKRRQQLLLAAGRNDEALQTLHQRIANQPADAELLLEGVKLANGMGLTAQAIEWNEAYLQIRPLDIDAMERQVSYSLASKQLVSARLWARKLVENDPMNKKHRLKLAQLEEWNGDPGKAQKQRMWLASHHPTTANDQELIRLAELNWDAATAAKSLLRISTRKPLNTEDVLKLVKLYEQDGRPDLAANGLNEMMTGSSRDAMLLRELAALHKRHEKYEKSLQAWQTIADRFGTSSEESINRMELLWRLKQTNGALAASGRVNRRYLKNASSYQIKLFSELGWRYQKPPMVIAAAPYINQLEMDDLTWHVYGRRLVQSLADNGEIKAAIEYSEKLWRNTDEKQFLLSAMHLAYEHNVYPHLERYLDATGDLLELRDIPEYWLRVAEYYIQHADKQAALETYQNTLAMDPDNPIAIAGIIWIYLGDDENQKLADTLDQYQTLAIDLPELWSPFAVGFMKIKQPENSLRWFSKIMMNDDHDYNILLSFADALDQTGNRNHAFKVRNYALAKLRPLVLANAEEKTNTLARDYISLLRTYGSASENELWTQRLINELPGSSPEELAWRHEMAASWYLTTQRSDYARLLMTRLHEKRLKTPVWQQLALAISDDDVGTIEEILASGQELSSGDRVLALRTIGHDRQAYTLAKNTMNNSSSEDERQTARQHVMALRANRPGYYAGSINQRGIGKLNITESGLSLRHTLAAVDLGFAVDYKRSQLASDRYAITEEIEDDVAVSAFFGNSQRGGRFTTGKQTQGDSDLNYTSGQYYVRNRSGKKELTTEVAFNEVVTGNSPELRLAAKQDTAELAYQQSVGKNEFIKVSGNLNEITTRAANEKISKGLGASIELGTRGSFGSNTWSMGLIASSTANESSATMPANSIGVPQYLLRQATLNDVASQLAVSASISRGGIKTNYPTAASPRYHMQAKLGHNWPDDSVALQLQAGAGFRLLGNDELSFELVHDQSGDIKAPGISNSVVGIQYRNHF